MDRRYISFERKIYIFWAEDIYILKSNLHCVFQHETSSLPTRTYIFANTYVHLHQHVRTSLPTRTYIFANTYVHLRQHVRTSLPTRMYIFANTYIRIKCNGALTQVVKMIHPALKYCVDLFRFMEDPDKTWNEILARKTQKGTSGTDLIWMKGAYFAKKRPESLVLQAFGAGFYYILSFTGQQYFCYSSCERFYLSKPHPPYEKAREPNSTCSAPPSWGGGS